MLFFNSATDEERFVFDSLIKLAAIFVRHGKDMKLSKIMLGVAAAYAANTMGDPRELDALEEVITKAARKNLLDRGIDPDNEDELLAEFNELTRHLKQS